MTKQKSKVTFINAVQDYWVRYFYFKGVSTRAQYWWALLFVVLVNVFCSLTHLWGLSIIVSILLFIPSRTVAFRRFHDVGLSGWWNLGPYILFFLWWLVRGDVWMSYLNLEYFPMDLKVCALLVVMWSVFNLFVLVQPSKKINNKYNK